jgi:hypothetical protein
MGRCLPGLGGDLAGGGCLAWRLGLASAAANFISDERRRRRRWKGSLPAEFIRASVGPHQGHGGKWLPGGPLCVFSFYFFQSSRAALGPKLHSKN